MKALGIIIMILSVVAFIGSLTGGIFMMCTKDYIAGSILLGTFVLSFYPLWEMFKTGLDLTTDIW